MNQNDRIDFSLLDPSRDPRRWEQQIAAITARAQARRRRPASVPQQLRAWSRPTLALAAALALLVWGGASLARSRPAEATEPTQLLSQWAANDEVPTTMTILEALGSDHVSR